MGDKEIYNPWFILNYARRKVLVPYWVNTSANTMLKQAIEKADYDFKKQYEKLIKNNYLETRVVLQTSFYEVANTPNLWGMFVSAGYLTVTKSIDALNDQYRVEIPNKEIRKEFINLTEYYLALQTGQLNDVVYNKYNFLIHDYFFAKNIDKVRPGGILALITSKGTLDKADSKCRRYLAERADLVGAIRLPDNAFKNAGTDVTTDIIFLQKREEMRTDNFPEWVDIDEYAEGININKYFIYFYFYIELV